MEVRWFDVRELVQLEIEEVHKAECMLAIYFSTWAGNFGTAVVGRNITFLV